MLHTCDSDTCTLETLGDCHINVHIYLLRISEHLPFYTRKIEIYRKYFILWILYGFQPIKIVKQSLNPFFKLRIKINMRMLIQVFAGRML